MQHCRRGVLGCPDNSIEIAICRYPWCGSRVGEAARGMGRSSCQSRVLKRESMNGITGCAVIQGSVEIGRHRENLAAQDAADFLINSTVICGVELAHVRAVHEKDIGVLAG